MCVIEHPRIGGELAPGGHVDEGESPEQAAVREVLEETGHRARLLAPPAPADYPHPLLPSAWHVADIPAAADSRASQRHLHRDHIFVGVADRPLSPTAEPEHPARWVLATDLPALDIPHDTLVMGSALFEAIESAAALRHPPAYDETLTAQLLARQETDQAVRLLPAAERGEDWGEQMRRVDRDNTAWLREVIADRGWPGRALVGPKASLSAWLIAQHADLDPDFQEQCLELLAAAFTAGDVDPQHAAMLEDRVRLARGRRQLFGTQVRPDANGIQIPVPIEDPTTVDERRALWGFEQTLAEYVQHFQGADR
ncbi:NUDIX domain-containing protein [Streptomyces sp. RKAG337]|nr:NUDIX domain-containing protein [Streptomyces sp. RKAG337]